MRGMMSRAMLAGAVLAFVLAGASGVVRGQEQDGACEWPEFRGPTGQGVSAAEDVPLNWGEGQNVAWKRKIPGQGWSSPVVRGGRLYLTTAAEGDAGFGLYAVCLDAATGELVWEKRVFDQEGRGRIHRKNSHASPTPIVTEDRLYVHFGHQGTACLDLSGDIMWTQRSLRYRPVHGNGGSPVLHGGKLIFNVDGAEKQFIVALDAATGEVAWRTPRSKDARRGFSFSTPRVIEVEGEDQIVSPASGAVYGIDPADGRELWRVDYDGGYSVVPRPVYSRGLVFICTGFTRPEMLAIDPTGRGNITKTHVKWRTGRAMPTIPSVLAVGDELYVTSSTGIASCFDAKTGEVHWRERLGGAVSASPVAAEGRVYFQLESGEAVVVKAGTEYEELSRNRLKTSKVQASWAVCDGAIFIRTAGHLYRIAGE